jgi:cyclohexa-1,5-dienecarbonyl-CoA hydratase
MAAGGGAFQGGQRDGAPDYQNILFRVAGPAAHISLNSPPYNVLTRAMMAEIVSAIERLDRLPEVKCLVLDSACPQVFSAGISLEDSRPEFAFQTLDGFARIAGALLEVAKPLIVAVHGPAVGVGAELALLGDLVLATPHAQFAQPEIRMGVFPPFAAAMLPAIVGPKKAYEMILTGQVIAADEALALRLVNRVVPEDQLETALGRIVARLDEFSAPVLAMAKAVISRAVSAPLREALKNAQDTYLNHLMDLEDVREGLRARLERRKPEWKNR